MSSSSNKLLVFGVLNYQISGGSRQERFGGVKLTTSGTGVTAETFNPSVNDTTGPRGIRMQFASSSSSYRVAGFAPINHLFSPAIAGSVTVTLFGEGYDADYGAMEVNVTTGTAPNGKSTLMLMEMVS